MYLHCPWMPRRINISCYRETAWIFTFTLLLKGFPNDASMVDTLPFYRCNLCSCGNDHLTLFWHFKLEHLCRKSNPQNPNTVQSLHIPCSQHKNCHLGTWVQTSAPRDASTHAVPQLGQWLRSDRLAVFIRKNKKNLLTPSSQTVFPQKYKWYETNPTKIQVTSGTVQFLYKLVTQQKSW